MQCHTIVLDTTGTTYARQQPRYMNEREIEDSISGIPFGTMETQTGLDASP